MQISENSIQIDSKDVIVKNLSKIYCKNSGIIKADILNYYVKTSSLILPHIKNKPFSMIHFPEGVGGKSFYQKEKPKNAPLWLNSVALPSSRRELNWCLLNDTASIVYMANRSVIEMHSWFSRLPSLNTPDVAVIDLDPSGLSGFNEAKIIARAFGLILQKMGVFAVPKTSGGRGIHIYIPIIPIEFKKVQQFLLHLCEIILQKFSHIATLERTISKRGDKIYLDIVQNAQGKTIAAPYSLRAKDGLPVSTPLLWEELENENLSPRDFNIKNIFKRIKEKGDLFKDFYKKPQNIENIF